MRIRQIISDLTDLDPQHYFLSALKKINYRIPFSSDTEDEEDKPKGGRKTAKKKQDDSSDDMVDWRYEYLQYRYITALKGKF